jgi:carboxyl-terminal processing protease
MLAQKYDFDKIKKHWYTVSMKRKILLGTSVFVLALGLLGGVYVAGYTIGTKHPEIVTVRGVENIDANGVANIDFGTFWQAWEVINNSYLKNENVSNEKKLQGAIKGLVDSLGDPYTEYFPPEDNKKFLEDISGNFGGIGAELGIQNRQLVVIAPLKGTPAERAGLQAGDAILLINTSSTENISIEEAVNSIRGPKDTAVKLTIFRDGWEKPKEFNIIRETIVVPTVKATKIGDIARVELYNFNDNADSAFYDAVAGALGDGSKGLILDLRNDPGGYLEVAVDLAGWFLPKGTLVVSEEGRSDAARVAGEGNSNDVVKLQEFKANGNGALVDFPVVVLIDKGSASASEILAGALHDQRKDIKLVGETSFGKGTVQQLENLTDGSSVKVTIAHWVLPSGHILENGGIKPDVEVAITDDDIKNKKDPQLDKAVEVLKAEIAK